MCFKTTFTITIYLLTLFSNFTCKASDHEPSKPNIILISADDLGWSDIGCYGSEIKTPNLDKLADQGMRFTHFHNTSKCFPSRACLITGVYAQDCGYDKLSSNPIKNAVTIGEVLQEAGYLTYWSGKHHGKENPYTRGFDHYYGLKDGCCNYFNPGIQRENEKKPAQKKMRQWCIDSASYHPYTPKEPDFYTTDYFTNYALKYINEASEINQPFFLYLAYTSPHDPLMAWPSDIKKYKGKYDVGYEKIRADRYKKQLNSGLIDTSYTLSTSTHKPWKSLSSEEQKFEAQKMEVYAAMIDRMDQNIGRVIKELKRLNQLDNSIILFVSDNGASGEVVDLGNDDKQANPGAIDRWISLGEDWANVSNTPLRYYKTYSYEGGINTPLIAWWPSRIKANTTTHFAGHFIDIMPTIIDITGAQYPQKHHTEHITPMRGVSLLPAFDGRDVKRKDPLYWQWSKGEALLYHNWKIVRHGNENNWDLYRIDQDPTEISNLSNTYPKMTHKLDSLYQEWLSQYD